MRRRLDSWVFKSKEKKTKERKKGERRKGQHGLIAQLDGLEDLGLFDDGGVS